MTADVLSNGILFVSTKQHSLTGTGVEKIRNLWGSASMTRRKVFYCSHCGSSSWNFCLLLHYLASENTQSNEDRNIKMPPSQKADLSFTIFMNFSWSNLQIRPRALYLRTFLTLSTEPKTSFLQNVITDRLEASFFVAEDRWPDCWTVERKLVRNHSLHRPLEVAIMFSTDWVFHDSCSMFCG